MGCNVFANGNEIACKAGEGKVIAAFPDVCLSPPSPPAGPVPVPYPDTSFSKDMKNGSKTVKIKGKEVMLKDQSYYNTSPLGDEAATKGLGAGVVTHVITGKTYFNAWSMDVKFEGENVDRHCDMTTSNHASPGGNSAPSLNIAQQQKRRLKNMQCPCCGKKYPECKAAPQKTDDPKDNEPMNFEQYYGLNEVDARGRPTQRAVKRRQEYAEFKRKKKEECTCEGEVFPQAPCNTFRKDKSARKKEIENQWDEQGRKERYADDYRKRNPTGTKKSIAAFVKRNPKEPKPPTKGAFKKVNHLVPKSAGGCTISNNNLQPHDLLCKTCKGIDDYMTEHWQG